MEIIVKIIKRYLKKPICRQFTIKWFAASLALKNGDEFLSRYVDCPFLMFIRAAGIGRDISSPIASSAHSLCKEAEKGPNSSCYWKLKTHKHGICFVCTLGFNCSFRTITPVPMRTYLLFLTPGVLCLPIIFSFMNGVADQREYAETLTKCMKEKASYQIHESMAARLPNQC